MQFFFISANLVKIGFVKPVYHTSFIRHILMAGSISAIFGSTLGSIGQSSAVPHKGIAKDENLYKSKSVAAEKTKNDDQQKRVEELKRIDERVRSHEASHAAAAGGLAQGTSFNMTTGPDGKQYATGGEVRIDISPVSGNPRATIAKMQVVRRAALAPMDPSGQDRAVAATAAATEAQARTELAEALSSQQIERQATAGNERHSLIITAYRKPQTSAQSSFSTVV